MKNTNDIATIIARMPDTFTPTTIDKCFKIYDGGKTVRRHLRKTFATEMAHEHRDNWKFDKTTDTGKKIIEFFATRYGETFDPKCVLLNKPE